MGREEASWHGDGRRLHPFVIGIMNVTALMGEGSKPARVTMGFLPRRDKVEGCG